MTQPDLQGPYDEFVSRLKDIRRIACAMESCYRNPSLIQSSRPTADLAGIGATTSNNVNSMAIVFIASSYEDFVREELTACANYICSNYTLTSDTVKHNIRNAYWKSTLQQLGYSKSILTQTKPNVPDPAIIAKIRSLLESASMLVLDDNPSQIDTTTVVQHNNNFRPHVVDEISARIGIRNLIARTAEGTKIKTYFGVATGADAAKRLRLKLDDFYARRNQVVHSLSSISGYGVNDVLDSIDLFDAVADSMRLALTKVVSNWSSGLLPP